MEQDINELQIIEMGRQHFPHLSEDQILKAFEEYRKVLPPELSNVEIVQIINEMMKERKDNRFGDLKGMLGK